jgi:hypothetical protein
VSTTLAHLHVSVLAMRGHRAGVSCRARCVQCQRWWHAVCAKRVICASWESHCAARRHAARHVLCTSESRPWRRCEQPTVTSRRQRSDSNGRSPWQWVRARRRRSQLHRCVCHHHSKRCGLRPRRVVPGAGTRADTRAVPVDVSLGWDLLQPLLKQRSADGR